MVRRLVALAPYPVPLERDDPMADIDGPMGASVGAGQPDLHRGGGCDGRRRAVCGLARPADELGGGGRPAA
eukprot:5551164-Prymnesium_polylepis.1